MAAEGLKHSEANNRSSISSIAGARVRLLSAIEASTSSDSAATRVDSVERSELERTESKTRPDRWVCREARSERSFRVWWITSGSRLSWRERVRVSNIEETAGAGVEGLMIKDLRAARVSVERGSLGETDGRLRV